MNTRQDTAYRSPASVLYADVLQVMIRPGDFYADMPAEKDLRQSFVFLCLCAGVYSLGAALFAPGNHLAWFLTGLANSLLIPAMTIAVLHPLTCLGNKTRTSLTDTARIVFFANAILLFSWIPGMAPWAEIYKYFLIGTGLAKAEKIPTLKAATLTLATIALMALLFHFIRKLAIFIFHL